MEKSEMRDALRKFSKSEDFLRRWCPRDLLMPVKKETKHPMMPHSGGRWSWRKLDEWRQVNSSAAESYDACVLMSDLCVIDVDDEEMAVRLESKFPILHSVPMEKTRRGRHYWFRRSEEADLFGYYDGHGQREKGIDFKTRCRTGTGGVVVIAPSSGKTWEKGRELNPNTLVPIPFDLLDAVASPMHKLERHRFRFLDSESVEMETVSLSTMSYFEPFVQHELFIDCEEIHVPCSRDEFETLMRVLLFSPSRDKWNPAPSPEEWSTAIRVGDKLGLDEEIDIHAKMAQSTTLWRHDLVRLWPEMARAIDMEHAYRRGEGCDDSICIDVASSLDETGRIVYEPVPKKKTWSEEDHSMFGKRGPRSRHVGGMTTVIDADSIGRAKTQLPESVVRLIDEFPLVLAGGSVLGMIAAPGLVEKGHDYDLFAYGLDDEAADQMLHTISDSILPSPAWRLIQTPNAWTFLEQERRFQEGHSPVVIQVILRLYRNPYEVPVGFDIAASRVALWKERGDLTIRACPSWLETMRRMTILVEPFEGLFSKATTMRVVKYAGKGFDVIMPGLRKTFANQEAVKTKDDLRRLRGVRSILFVHQSLNGRWPDENIRRHELPRVVRSMRTVVSEYAEEEIKLTERFFNAIRSLSWVCLRIAKRCFGHRTRSGNALAVNENENARLTLWRKFGDRQPSEFKPECPSLRNLHLGQEESFEIACCESLGIEPRRSITLSRRIDVALVQIANPTSQLLNAILIANIYRSVYSGEGSDPATAVETYRRVYREVIEETSDGVLPRRDYIRMLVEREFRNMRATRMLE